MITADFSLEETAELDFKASFDVKHDWCELIKDIVAMANSSGGRILVGVSDDGVPSGCDVSPLLATDLADVINKIRGFTDVNFAAMVIRPFSYQGVQIAEVAIQPAPTPLVFGKTGNYTDANNKPQCAFRQGMLYVRHGPKSEPATSDDVRTLIEQTVEKHRKALLSNLRQVIEAPANAVITIANRTASVSADGNISAVRIVDGPTAREAVVLDVNFTHPHRQKDVIEAINRHFAGSVRFTTNDNIAIRRLHKIEVLTKFYYRPKFGSGQYSDAYVQWAIEQIAADTNFLSNIRRNYHQLLVSNNQQRKLASS
ncbi:MAG TPA: RNA-binding domain-containing protein [Opitutaceae bacterium]|nr:RNA-binding domain-containing protein [Opitutaceae bacterium]